MNTKRKCKLESLIIFFVILFVACTSAPTQVIETAEPTATARPSFTATPSITKTPYQTRTPKADFVILEESTSPDGVWTATITRTIRGKNYNLHFEVKNQQNNQIRVIENVDFAEPEPLMGYKYPYIFKWSEDGNYLYYSHLSTGGDGCYIPRRPSGFDFKRFELLTGETVTIIEEMATWMSLSPDESKLTYIPNWDGNVIVVDTSNKQKLEFPHPSTPNEYSLIDTTEYAIWSPDGNTIVYAYLWGVCGEYRYSYIVLINLKTQQQAVVISRDEHGYIPVEWNIQDRIILKDNDDNLWWLNPNTKEIIPAQP